MTDKPLSEAELPELPPYRDGIIVRHWVDDDGKFQIEMINPFDFYILPPDDE